MIHHIHHALRSSIAIGLLLILTALTSACGLGAYTTQVTETSGVTTPPGPLTVTVTNFDGPIRVTAGPDGRVEAELIRGSRHDDLATAQAEAEAIQMAISQTGADVRIDVEYSGTTPHQAEATLNVVVPAGSSLDLRTATGEIDAREPLGDVTAQIDSGGIIFGALEEDSFGLTIQGKGELQSDFETLSSRPLTATYEGQVGDAPTRQLTAVIGQGKVFLRQLSAP
jgi:hypothetical protein